jgi:hypothetical protein
MSYIYSTLSAGIDFQIRDQHGDVTRTVTIAGGANIANKHMLTSAGVATKIGDEDLKELQKTQLFNDQVKAGFLRVDIAKIDADKAAKAMTAADKSAPAKPDSFKQSALGESVEVKTKNK